MKEILARLKDLRAARAWDRYAAARGNLLAGGIAYIALFSVGAALVVGFTVLGSVLGANEELRDEVVRSVDEQLPGLLDLGDGGLVPPEDLFATSFGNWAGALALAVALFTGLGWLDAVREGLRTVFGVPRDRTFVVLKKLKDALVMATIGLVVLLSAVLSLVTSSAGTWLLGLVGLADAAVAQLLLRGLSILVVLFVDTLVFAVLFRVLTGLSLPWRVVRGGALAGAVAVGLLKQFAGLLLGNAGGSNPVLAGSAVLVGLLLWMNLLSRATLLAAAWAAESADADARAPETVLDDAMGLSDPAAATGVDGRGTGGRPAGRALAGAAAGGAAPAGPGPAVGLATVGQRARDRTTLAAGAVLGAFAVAGVRVMAGGVRSVRDALRASQD